MCLCFRPILVLKCDQGFVGYKSNSSTKLECNKANYETIQVERADKGVVYFKVIYLYTYRSTNILEIRMLGIYCSLKFDRILVVTIRHNHHYKGAV